MPQFTKRAIKDAFMSLLNERPFEKITVKDIIEKEEIFELENKVEDGYYVSELKIKKKKINSN